MLLQEPGRRRSRENLTQSTAAKSGTAEAAAVLTRMTMKSSTVVTAASTTLATTPNPRPSSKKEFQSRHHLGAKRPNEQAALTVMAVVTVHHRNLIRNGQKEAGSVGMMVVSLVQTDTLTRTAGEIGPVPLWLGEAGIVPPHPPRLPGETGVETGSLSPLHLPDEIGTGHRHKTDARNPLSPGGMETDHRPTDRGTGGGIPIPEGTKTLDKARSDAGRGFMNCLR